MLADLDSHFHPLYDGCMDNRTNWNGLADLAKNGDIPDSSLKHAAKGTDLSDFLTKCLVCVTYTMLGRIKSSPMFFIAFSYLYFTAQLVFIYVFPLMFLCL